MRRGLTPLRRTAAAAAAALMPVPALLLAAAPAHAAGYRYWSYWEGTASGGWTYAQVGPSMARPADGSVQGFRFAVSADAAAKAAQPRTPADFAAVCAATPAAEGRKRIAVVVDFGVPADAPAGEAPPQDAPRTACAQVAPDAGAAEALAAVAKPLRYNGSAMLCGISGYPRQGCGEQVADEPGPAAAPTGTPDTAAAEPASDSDGSGWAGLLAGAAALAAVAGAALWQSRRRSR
ncbi:SCO2322 family protein [Streptomyces toxytricini]|uniref:SCO2322 family protein n=1 Tax=Streptomyces toxytricini TaxID=67369 RepID=A0ABW8EB91_STRT5